MQRIFAVALFLLLTLPVFGSTVYVSQAGGSQSCGADGVQTTTAYSALTQSASNTYKLCGVLTQPFVVGANSISIIFESGAGIAVGGSGCGNGCIQLNGHTGGLIDGGNACGPNTTCSTNFGEYGLGSRSGSGYVIQTTTGTPAATITNITCSGGVATVTGPSAFGYSLPNEPQVTISGNSVSSYNGTWTVASNTDASKQFTFAATCGGTGTGGQVGVLCPSGSYCTNATTTNMIDAETSGGSGWEIRNLLIGPYYQRTSYTDTAETGGYYESIYAMGCNGCSTLIHDNTMANAGVVYVPASSGDNGLQIYNNALLGGSDSIVIPGSASSNILTGAQIHDNLITDNAIGGDKAGCPVHEDGIHVWGTGGGSISGINLYNNWFTGNMGGCPTGAIFFEGLTHDNTFYNNVVTITYTQNNNGNVILSGYNLVFDNNTIVGHAVSDLCFGVTQSADTTTPFTPSITFRNNVITGCNTIANIQETATTITAWDHNTYGCDSSTSGSCSGWAATSPVVFWQGSTCSHGGSGYCDLADMQGFGYDSGSTWNYTTGSMHLNSSTGVPASGSPIIGAGANLYGIYTAMNSDTSAGLTRTPTARPSSGNWDVGAYQYSSGTNYSLTVSVSGTGAGTFSGTNCVAGVNSYASGTSVVCNVTATSGTFTGWSGTGSASGCTGAGSCSFTLAANSTFTATINLSSTINRILGAHTLGGGRIIR